MKGFVGELQRRGVLRVAGFYVALSWLALQAADVVFPALGLADSTLRYVLYAAIGGLPVALLLAWFFEITPEGILTEEEVRDHHSKRSGNQALTVATIVALVLALSISLFANFKQAIDAPVAQPSLVSILVADFANSTGDPLFDGSLESALTIGLEGAPFISSYARHIANRLAEQITSSSILNENTARLVSVREGIDLVLAGSIVKTANGYELSQRALDPSEGVVVAQAQATAADKAGVLQAVGDLAAQIREALGDVSLEGGSLAETETFTSSSLQAVQYYTTAQTHAFREENLKAIEFFEKAAIEDPNFGRAYAGWATSETKLGHREKAEELWKKTLSLIDGMSEREKYRTLGVYYTLVTANYAKAIENYELLVEKFPADGIAWNNLGVAYFYTLQFGKAMEVGKELVDLFPNNPAFSANYALFAMYAGDFAAARSEAERLLLEEPDYFLAYLPIAMADIVDGKLGVAESVYQRMAAIGRRADSVATTGLADIAQLRGDYPRAVALLEQGRQTDLANNNSWGGAYKGVYLAVAQAALGERDSALANLAQSLQDNDALSHVIPAAMVYIELGELAAAAEIQRELASQLQQQYRAAAELIDGMIALAEADPEAAILSLQSSLQRTDSWLTHMALGRALVAAGKLAEALAEFELCLARIGESTAVFLDDIPTFQYHAAVYYWLGRTRQELNMPDQARADLEHYLGLRVASDAAAMTLDARQRLQGLANPG